MTSKWTADNIPDQTGRTAIVTGANSGIGYETARALARKGGAVILACRNQQKGEAALQQILQAHPGANIKLMLLDLSDLASVQHFVEQFVSHHNRLDMLINNAGIMRTPSGKTADGFELQFGTNHLGHFALTGLLLDLITRTPKARVVTVSSGGERFSQIDLDNLNAEQGYDAGFAYGQSKLANLLFTYELQRRFDGAGVDAIAAAAHPGWTATNLPVHWRMLQILNPLIGQQPAMGALPTLYAATASDVQGGDYYGPDGFFELRGHPTKVKSSNQSYDTEVATKLWMVSEELTSVRYHWADSANANFYDW
jgi:NAD(P)-dependent dehydrogenase (short-subunit alcohol dehydrogenase family)